MARTADVLMALNMLVYGITLLVLGLSSGWLGVPMGCIGLLALVMAAVIAKR